MQLKWFHTWIVRIARKLGAYGTLDSERAIRTLKVENITLKKEIERRQGFQVAYIDPELRQKGYAQSAWNSGPEPHTDPLKAPKYIEMIHTQNITQMNLPPKFHEMLHGAMLPDEIRPRTFTTRRLQPCDGSTPHEAPAFLKDKKVG